MGLLAILLMIFICIYFAVMLHMTYPAEFPGACWLKKCSVDCWALPVHLLSTVQREKLYLQKTKQCMMGNLEKSKPLLEYKALKLTRKASMKSQKNEK